MTMDTADTADTAGAPAPIPLWTTPRLEDLGGMSEVMGGARPPNTDSAVSPSLPPS